MFTDITVLLDRSGSMVSIKDDTIGGFNQFLANQQALPGEATLTLVQFDSLGYDVVINALPIILAQPLTPQTFVPRGGTPLYDALGRLIVETGARLKGMSELRRPAKVIFVIITDGQENASREYMDARKISQMVEHQRDVYKWEFIYLGANQDAIVAAGHMGIPQNYAATYTANAFGTRRAYDGIDHAVASARLGQSAEIDEDDRKNMNTPNTP